MERRTDNRLHFLAFKQQWIAVAAYFCAEHRGFVPGHELEDWFQAETQFNTMLVQRFHDNCEEDGVMTVCGLRHLAELIGIEQFEAIDHQTTLIQAIQSALHTQPCFGTHRNEYCPELPHCPWKTECNKLIAKWR